MKQPSKLYISSPTQRRERFFGCITRQWLDVSMEVYPEQQLHTWREWLKDVISGVLTSSKHLDFNFNGFWRQPQKNVLYFQKEFPAHSQTLEVSIMSTMVLRIWEKDSQKKGVRFKNGNFILSTNHDFSFSPKPSGWIPSWLLPLKSSWNSTEILKTLHLHPVYSPETRLTTKEVGDALTFEVRPPKGHLKTIHLFGVKNCHSLDIQSYLLRRMVSWGMLFRVKYQTSGGVWMSRDCFFTSSFFLVELLFKTPNPQKKIMGVFSPVVPSLSRFVWSVFFWGFSLVFPCFFAVFQDVGFHPDLHNCRF